MMLVGITRVMLSDLRVVDRRYLMAVERPLEAEPMSVGV